MDLFGLYHRLMNLVRPYTRTFPELKAIHWDLLSHTDAYTTNTMCNSSQCLGFVFTHVCSSVIVGKVQYKAINIHLISQPAILEGLNVFNHPKA